MPTRLLLEGADIETLLARVRDEHGSAARIVSADKVRTGGLGGFFSKQKFEIAIEVEEAEPAEPGEPADSVEALVERADAQESRLDRPAAPVPSTERPEFTALLATLRAGAADPATAPAVATAPAEHPAPVAAAVPPTAPTAPALAPAVAPALSTVPPPAAAPVPAMLPGRASLTAKPAPGRPGPAVAPALPYRPPVAPPPVIAAELTRLGVPEHLARLATGADRYAAVLRAMSALPAPPQPPAGPGDVLVVAGELAPAQALAVRLAAAVGVDPGRILVAAPGAVGVEVPADRRISGPAAAERRARRMRVADVPHLVVVAAPVDGASGEWAAATARALRATAVWAMVDCTRKPADLARHLRSLGRVDALAGHAAAASDDPATVLGLDLPVSYLDGRPATPGAWTALLCERLTIAMGQ